MDTFDDIRPYNEEEAPAVYRQLMDDRRFQEAITKCLPNYSILDFRKDFDQYHSIYEVQTNFIKRFIEVFIQQSTSGVNLQGAENIDPNKSYLYIANHRDITFDAALLQYYFFLEGINSSKIAIGDNLIATPVLGEIARLNKMFLVKRSGSLREKITIYKQLSAFIQHSLFEEKESVWIAQRDGRTKDGYDFTKQGLIKMLTMGHEKELITTARKLNIVPLTISYEYEPCDALKARELALSENQQHYQKYPGEDFDSIKSGIFDFKGKISLVIGTPLDQELDTIPADISNNDKLFSISQLIDNQIYKNYKLYANNYIAYDLMHNCDTYHHYYSEEEKQHFINYLDKKSCTRDVSKEKMRKFLLQIYATPVNNHYEKPINRRQ